MALSQTPTLIQAINDAFKTYHSIIYAQPGQITEQNYSTDPVTRELQARTQVSEDIGNAVTSFIEDTIFTVDPGLITVGSPTTQSSVSPAPISKA